MTQNRDSYTNRYTNDDKSKCWMARKYELTRCPDCRCARRDLNAEPSDPKSDNGRELAPRTTPLTHVGEPNPVRLAHYGYPNSARSLHESLHESGAAVSGGDV